MRSIEVGVEKIDEKIDRAYKDRFISFGFLHPNFAKSDFSTPTLRSLPCCFVTYHIEIIDVF